MKYLSTILTLFVVSLALGAPANKTLNVPIYETASTSFVGRTFTVSGNNGKVLGITGGDWALVSPLFGTSPTITTSILTDSTTFGLFNTTATTINAFGAATTLNVGASAATVLNFGGATSAAQFRFLEPSASGTNYTGFKAQAQAGNVTYTLPAADGTNGQFLKTNGSGLLSWGTASGGGGGGVGSEGGNGVADSGLYALFSSTGTLSASTQLIVESASTTAKAYLADDGTIGFHAAGETNPRELVFPDDVLENESKEIATRPWVLANAGGGSLTSTYVGYGSGANAVTGEAAFIYTAASDLLTVPNVYASTSIELGAASDTTVTRSAAGAIAVEGVAVPTISSTSTLTNKTITAPIYTEVAVAALDIDWSAGSTFTKTLSANTTFTFSNLANGKTITVAVTNTASNYTVSWPTVSWPGGTAPVQTVGVKTDIYSFWRINGTVYGAYVQNY